MYFPRAAATFLVLHVTILNSGSHMFLECLKLVEN